MRHGNHRYLLSALFIAASAFSVSALAKVQGYHYAGLEFFGSSQITRLDLDRLSQLKSTANGDSVQKSMDRLNKELLNRHLNANVEVVAAKPDKLFLVVDISDSALTSKLPTRHLKDPGHRDLHSDKPFLLLNDLHQRIEQLKQAGIANQEDFKDGIKSYQDEACNQIVDRLLKWVPTVENELIAVIDSDPDPARRANAVELLNWADDTTRCAIYLIAVIDDADAGVRVQADKFLYPRLNLLPQAFPADKLAYAWSRQLIRPSHDDRSKALYCLLALTKQFPETIPLVKSLCLAKINALAQDSIIDTVAKPASELAAILDKAQGLPSPAPSGPTSPDKW